MKIATFNIQNLFHRDVSLMENTKSKCVSNWISEFDTLLQGKNAINTNNDRLRELSFLLGFDKTFQNPYAVMRRKAGNLYLKGMNYSKELKSGELTDWNGWIKVQTTPINTDATNHKARVLAEVDPDILILQEVEDRISLEEFNNLILPKYDCEPFTESLLIPGIEGKGRELAILLKNDYKVISTKIHTIDTAEYPTQDLIEYEIGSPNGNTFYILSAYLFSNESKKDRAFVIRKQQASEIAQRYKTLQKEGKVNVIVVGTFNAPSYCNSLTPLLQDTNLKDVTKHLSFEVDIDEGEDAVYFRLGAYRMGVNIKQKDYFLLSPTLFKQMKDSGLNRRAVWSENRPKWPNYPSLDSKRKAASEHPVVWCNINEFI